MLAGYSRGGSAAVIAASMLKAAGRTVDFLFLFDPVARHLSGDTSTIPSNVKEACVARRMIGAPEMNTTTCGSATGLDTIQCVRSSYPPESAARPVLENIGKNGRFTVRTFTKTHGKGVSAHRMMCLKSEGPQLTLTEMRGKRAKVARSLWHRPLQVKFSAAVSPVTSRGDGREALFADDTDRPLFLTANLTSSFLSPLTLAPKAGLGLTFSPPLAL